MRAEGGGHLDLRLLLPALVAWAALAALLGAPSRSVSIVGAAAGLVGLIVLIGGRGPVAGLVGLACIATTLVLLAMIGHRAVADSGLVPSLAQRSATVRVEAKVVSDPRPVASSSGEEPVWRVRLQIIRVYGRGEVSGARTPVLAFGGGQVGALRWHEKVVAAGRLRSAETGSDVSGVLRLKSVQRTEPAGVLERVVERLRSGLRDATDGLPDDPAGLVPALVIGDTSRLPQDLNDNMRDTGMSHLNAVSGSNVTVVLLCVQSLAGVLRVRRRWRLPFAFAGLALFVMLCRPEPSVIRASAMGVVGLLALQGGSRKAGAPALAAAVLLLLVVDPHLSRSFGFVLSSFATLGLLLFARRWADAIGQLLPPRAMPLAEAISVPLAAQAFCAPITVLLQPSISLVGLPANVLAAPLVPAATIAGVLVVCVAPLSSNLAEVLAWVAGVPAWGIALVARGAAAVPYGSLPWPGGWFGAVLLIAVILAVLTTAHWWLHQVRDFPWRAGTAALTVIAVIAPVPAPAPDGGWVVAMCDVGQGDAAVVRSPAGGVLVIDSGPDPEPVDDCLTRLGIRRIDLVVLTHFHADHVGGLAGVLRGRRVAEVGVTSIEAQDAAGKGEEASAREPTMTLIERSALAVRPLRTGDELRAAGIIARVVWPGRSIDAGSAENNGSVVLDVDVAGLRGLFTGDIEREAGAAVRRNLSTAGDTRRFDLLKVAHHGSANQDDGLLELVRPRVCLIGVGADNDYGHPAPRTLTRLRGCTVLRTDQGGMIRLYPVSGSLTVGRG